jgi:hypothetical protein
MSGNSYYDFPDSAKPRVEIREILVCWFTTGLMLAFFAFLLKVSVDHSRGGLRGPLFPRGRGLLGVRKLTRIALAAKISKGAIGRRDVVMIGDFNEIAALQSRDLLAFFGAGEINRFTLSREDDDPSGRLSSDTRIINSVANFVRRHDSREILLALPWGDTSRIEFVRDQIKVLPVAVRLLPDTQVRSLTNFRSSARQRVLAIEIQRVPSVRPSVSQSAARVTPIGRLLRSASIDELPQIVNVSRGEMSLIGPPHALAHDNYFESILGDYAFRRHVKPGITGWAQ